ncbi:TcfC E-set like domain-containing protein [Sinobacterium norvegicum]|nr:CS1-pili formation C-terminal domain-containing protein [Sinobacterium norvegicum]
MLMMAFKPTLSPEITRQPEPQKKAAKTTVVAAPVVVETPPPAAKPVEKKKPMIARQLPAPLPAVKTSPARSGVPAGFEHLMAEQTILTDVYYGGRYITQTLITYTPTHMRFEDPEGVAVVLPALRQKQAVVTALSGQLSNNLSLICREPGQQDCGVLRPEVAGVIFNPDSFRLEVFVNQQYLTVAPVDQLKYLPSSTSNELTFIQQLGVEYSGSDEGDDVYNIRGSSLLALREHALRSEWNVTDDRGFEVDTLYWQYDKNGQTSSAGYLRGSNNNLTFSSSSQLLGGHWGSSNLTRIDNDVQSSNDILIFMPVRGRVEVYREGRLISSQILDVGNHMLDTGNFPSGGYNIDIVIKDGSNEVSRETRYFVKDNRLPPKDSPEYYIEVGQLVSHDYQYEESSANASINTNGEVDGQNSDALPTTTDGGWQLRSGYNYRLADQLGVGVGFAADESNMLVEPSFLWVGPNTRVSASVMASQEQDYGYAVDVQWSYDKFTLSANSRELDANQQRVDDELNNTDPNAAQPLLGNSYVQHGMNINYLLPLGSVSYNSSYSKREGDVSRIKSLSWGGTLINSGRNNLSGSVSLSRENDDYALLFSLTYQMNSEHWSNSIRPNVEATRTEQPDGSIEEDRTERVTLQSQWYDRDILPGDLDVDNQLDIGSGGDSIQSAVNYQHRLVDMRGQVLHSRESSGRNVTSYSAGVDTGFVLGGDAKPSVGGNSGREAAIVVEIDGKASSKSYFDVEVNGQQRGYVGVGERTVISVMPYETYDVRIVPRGENQLGYRDKIETVTVYPGNVVGLEWQAESLTIVFGRLIDADGEPLANAILREGMTTANSDAFGLFQLEVAGDQRQLLFEHKQGYCQVILNSNYSVQNGVGFLGDVACMPIAKQVGEAMESANE